MSSPAERARSSARRPPGDPGSRRVVDPDAERVAATRALLLDTAERLLAERAYDDVSGRAITTAAGVNPAAIQYHFGSKQGLLAALLEARFAGVVARTQAASDALLVAGEVDITDIVRLQVEPLVELARRPGRGRLYVRLLARAYLSRWTIEWDVPLFRVETWARMASRAVPQVPYDVVEGRWRLATELALLQTGRPFETDVDGEWDLDARALVEFISAGVGAPWPAGEVE
jgi:AcrR family transcriptional regulator